MWTSVSREKAILYEKYLGWFNSTPRLRQVRFGPILLCFCVSLLLAGSGESQTLFTDVTERVGLQVFPGRSAANLVFVDYDNDGFQDVFIAENRFFPRRVGLFHNTGDGRFVDQTFLIPSDLHLEDGGAGSIWEIPGMR